MANLWDSLDTEQRRALINQHVASNGGKTPENINRATQQLSQNPNLVQRLAKELGIAEDEPVEQDAEESSAIDTALDQGMIEEGDVQEAGEVTKSRPYGDSDIPPPEAGESIEKYIRRLSAGIGAGGR